MYSMLLEIWVHIAALRPRWMSMKPHFTFITLHYFLILGMILLGSLCIYIRGNINYIDALFFASGAATQSGLNTIDVNKLDTWQQLVLYWMPWVTNPISINTYVVFLRLYWFEKRFQHIARESTRNRRSIAKSFTKSKTLDRDHDAEERGVQGRRIVVMHDSTVANGTADQRLNIHEIEEHLRSEKEQMLEHEKVGSSNESGSEKASKGEGSNDGQEADKDEGQKPQIKFVDQVKPSHARALSGDDRLPVMRPTEEHIAILQRQRKSDDGAVLRIPGPRDADAGVAPQEVDHSDTIDQIVSRRDSNFDSRPSHEASRNQDSQNDAPRRNITIAEPERSPITEHIAEDAAAARHAVGALRLRKPRMFRSKQEKLHDDQHAAYAASRRTNTMQSIRSALSRDKEESMPYFSWEATVGRNSMFVDLTEEQREELGGIEYRSLKSLALILVVYFLGFQLIAVIGLLPWIYGDDTYGSVVTQAGQGRAWWGFFTASSAFTDLGFTLTPDSMISFNTAVWPLFFMSFLIIIGNTGFPIMLRIVIWLTSKWVPKDSGIWEELQFLLDHPRRCFTLLFPSGATWWLFWILILLNGIDLLFYIILDLGNDSVTKYPLHIRFLDGWFQAASTRTAGFGVTNLATLHPGIQVSYLVMMYISVLPIAISVRRTNVYEEKSLGIYGSPAEENEDEGEPSYVGAHLRRQLSFDLWYIFLGFFIIAISESSRLQNKEGQVGYDPNFSMFSVLFEVVSAYGTVGLSLGYTNINASFSAEFGVIAKLVIIAMQIRGRHRGLPYELDRAILLPSEHLQQEEAKQAAAQAASRLQRRSSIGTMATNTRTNRSDRSRSRGRSPDRANNFFSSLLQPGPTIPNIHRPNHRTEPVTPRPRRHSIAVTGSDAAAARKARSLSPRAFASGFFGGNNKDGAETDGANERKPEGRRNFYQEGVNPPPPENSSKDMGMRDITE